MHTDAQIIEIMRTLTGFPDGYRRRKLAFYLLGNEETSGPVGFDLEDLLAREVLRYGGQEVYNRLHRTLIATLPDMELHILGKQYSTKMVTPKAATQALNRLREKIGVSKEVIDEAEVRPLLNMPMCRVIPRLSQMLGVNPGYMWEWHEDAPDEPIFEEPFQIPDWWKLIEEEPFNKMWFAFLVPIQSLWGGMAASLKLFGALEEGASLGILECAGALLVGMVLTVVILIVYELVSFGAYAINYRHTHKNS